MFFEQINPLVQVRDKTHDLQIESRGTHSANRAVHSMLIITFTNAGIKFFFNASNLWFIGKYNLHVEKTFLLQLNLTNSKPNRFKIENYGNETRLICKSTKRQIASSSRSFEHQDFIDLIPVQGSKKMRAVNLSY